MSNMIDCLLEQDNLSETVNPTSIEVFEAEETVKIEERLEHKEPDLGFFLLEGFHRCFFGKGGYYVYPVLWVSLFTTLFLSLAIISIISPLFLLRWSVLGQAKAGASKR
jgi:hypothetical protein